VAQGNLTARQILSSSYTGGDYVLEAYGKQVSGRVWGVGARVNGANNLYSINLYGDLNTTNNLYSYSWVNNPTSIATNTLGRAAVGQVNANTWYKLTAKVHSSQLDIYKDGTLQIQVTDTQFPTGGIALYGERSTVAEFNNVLVRKYAATDPTTTVDQAASQVLSSLTLNPTTVAGANSSQGTVVLAAPAPSGGAIVSLASDNAAVATVPTSVTVAAGATSATFTVTTVDVSTPNYIAISATYNSVAVSATLYVYP
jgi:hypothetical protein